jgi:hypothetical protein
VLTLTLGPDSSKWMSPHFLVLSFDAMKYMRERFRSAMKQVPGVTAFLLMIPFFLFLPSVDRLPSDIVNFCVATDTARATGFEHVAGVQNAVDEPVCVPSGSTASREVRVHRLRTSPTCVGSQLSGCRPVLGTCERGSAQSCWLRGKWVRDARDVLM